MAAADSLTRTAGRERDDPLRAAALARVGAPERVHYAAGVLLDAADFDDEQGYLRGRLARVLSLLLGFGTLAGLRVRCVPADGPTLEAVVAPGAALDRLGRLVEVRRRQCCSIRQWLDLRRGLDPADPARAAVIDAVRSTDGGTPAAPVIVLDVFVRFVVCEHGKTPAFAAGPFNATDYVVPARLADAFEIVLDIAATGPGNALRRPASATPPLDQSLADLQALAATPDEQAARRRAWAVDSVLDAWPEPDPLAPERLPKLAEQATPDDWQRVLLARLTVPVTQAAPGAFPSLDDARLTAPESAATDLADNSLRPVVFLPTAWRGLA